MLLVAHMGNRTLEVKRTKVLTTGWVDAKSTQVGQGMPLEDQNEFYVSSFTFIVTSTPFVSRVETSNPS